MKKIRITVLAFLILISGITFAQQTEEINLADSTGLPGDHFSLEGALAMFKESSSLEEFEKKINSKDESINNLDLNSDGQVDYIKIITAKKENAHVIILQAPVSKTETQDVAVIEIEKDGDASAYLQIIGDKGLYGEEKIVEPKNETEVADPGVSKSGPSAFSHGSFFIHMNVWFWPCIRFMYAPAYVVYYSPWYWGYYPRWWSPWHPYPWNYHYMHTWHHHHHYHSVYHHRTTYAHQVYAPRRTTSVTVQKKYEGRVNQYRANNAVRPSNNVSTGRPIQNTQSRPVSKPNSNTVRPGNTTKSKTQPAAKPAPRPSSNPAARPVTKPNNGKRQVQPDPRSKDRSVTPKSGPAKNQVKPSYKQSPKGAAQPQRRSSMSTKSTSPSRTSSPNRKR